MHVHVAVPTPEACLAVMEGVLIELPVLLALSANSPFWRGERSGLQSTRTAIFAAMRNLLTFALAFASAAPSLAPPSRPLARATSADTSA